MHMAHPTFKTNRQGRHMNHHEKLNYVEFSAQDLPATKAFFAAVFDWIFTDYGDSYTAFNNQGLDGGFYQADRSSSMHNNGALLIFYSEHLTATRNKITDNNGVISQDIFEFPGGFRFHFTEPSGNEFAVWSENG